MKSTNPLMLTLIEAGFPSPADDAIDVDLNLHKFMVRRPEATFFMRVHGESMKNIGIGSGDIAVVDRSLTAKNGQIVVAFIDNEFTLKRFVQKGEKAWLMPENDQFSPIEINEDSGFEVWGVVTFVVKDMARA